MQQRYVLELRHDELCAAQILRHATKQISYLGCVRGASIRTVRRTAKAAAAVVLAFQLLGAGAPSQASAQCLPHFVNTAGFPDSGDYSTPTFADIDGDGDFDAFIGDEGPNYTWGFENTGTPRDPRFDFGRWDPFEMNEYLDWANPTLGDIDGDGDLDAFVGSTRGLAFSENVGTATAPAFVRRPDSPFGIPYFAFPHPVLVDLDGDGDLDLLVGDDDALTFVENTGTAKSPAFAGGVPGAFGLTGVSFAKPTVVDLDGDGDVDVVCGEDDNIIFFENVGSRKHPQFGAPIVNPFGLSGPQYGDAAPAFVDIDGDGDFDAYVGGSEGTTLFFENTGTSAAPSFRSSIRPFGLGAIHSDVALPAFVDMDGDGDSDAWINDPYEGMLFRRNIGTTASPVFAAPVTGGFGLVGAPFSEPVFADLDGDGDKDAFFGDAYVGIVFAKNTGTVATPAFAATTALPFNLTGTETPSFVDIDHDGDLDAFVSVSPSMFFENTGSATAPAFASPVSNPFGISNTEASEPGSPDFVDVDGDGDFDIIATGTHYIDQLDSYGYSYSTYRQTFEFMENTGSAISPAFAAPIANPFGLRDEGNYVRIAFADLDGDGRVDGFVGTKKTSGDSFEGGIQYYRNDADCAAHCPAQPMPGCKTPGRTSLKLQAPGDPTKQWLNWNWRKDTASKAEFGNPASGTSLLLCLYDDGELKQSTLIESGGDCSGDACWKETKGGFSRKNRAGIGDGTTKVRLASGGGKAKIQIAGKGAQLGLPELPLSQSSEVTVQLDKTRSSSTQCWESTFEAPARRNDDEHFKDDAP
ncbi:MAG: FG-GAP-like repeat-containing protein [bacterium]